MDSSKFTISETGIEQMVLPLWILLCSVVCFFPGWSDDGDLTLVKDDKLTELVDQLVRRGIVGPGVIYHLRPGHYLMDRSPD